jgi:hypothetical protein
MRRATPKRARFNTKASKWRRDYLESLGRCDLCGCRVLERLSLHELTQGTGTRLASLMEPAVILCLCDGFANNCHMKIHRMGKQGKVVALALLYLNRPGVFDLETVHRIRHDNWPELRDVMNEVRNLVQGESE